MLRETANDKSMVKNEIDLGVLVILMYTVLNFRPNGGCVITGYVFTVTVSSIMNYWHILRWMSRSCC